MTPLDLKNNIGTCGQLTTATVNMEDNTHQHDNEANDDEYMYGDDDELDGAEDGCGDENFSSEGDQPKSSNAEEISEIKRNLKWMDHQMRQLMTAFNVSYCNCAECQRTGLNNAAAALGPTQSSSGMCQSEANDFDKQNKEAYSDAHPGHIDVHCRRGRRSKYCTPHERKVVARYAQLYGASAAARKFGIPPAVAAYYHRKEYRRSSSTSNISGQNGYSGISSLKIPPIGNEIYEKINEEDIKPQVEKSATEDSTGEETQAINDPWAITHSQILRGRGRGRPKLIGDELDAELVEWMVALKQANPGQHLNAQQALLLARNYILEKSPGLLVENGGQVKLKITWAMKLLARVAEREKEIQLGLPPGTLQNISRTNVVNSTVPGSSIPTSFNELQQLFGKQVGSSKDGFMHPGNNLLPSGTELEDKSPDQILNGLIDGEFIHKLLGNIPSLGGNETSDFPSTSATQSSSTNEILAQATGAY